MASLSELPEKERRLALRLGYWSWLALLLGGVGIILWLRKVLPTTALTGAFLLVALFIAYEIWQPIYIRRVLRRKRGG